MGSDANDYDETNYNKTSEKRKKLKTEVLTWKRVCGFLMT